MNEIPTIITERVDDIPLLLEQMQRMGLPALLDGHFPTHGNWQGLTYGSPIFKAVQQKRCKALYTALTKSPKAPEYAVGEGSERSNVERSVVVPP